MLSKEQLNKFYSPIKDDTGKVYLMRYCNNGLSYGLSYPGGEQKFFLCSSPTLSAEIKRIISEHNSFEELRTAFFKLK